MVAPLKLNPKVRERKEARLTATSLATFIIASPDKQQTVLHDSRFMSSYVSAKYSDAMELIRAYALDPHRDPSILRNGMEALAAKSQSPNFKPSQREEALRCIETIRLFENGINAFGVNSAPFISPQRFDPLTIEGVLVSIQPTLLVGSTYPPTGKNKIGVVHIRPQKTPDPSGCKTDKTKLDREEFRRDVARYILTIEWMLLRNEGFEENQIDTKKMTVWDLRMREAIGFPSDRVSRINRIEAACDQINRLWSTVRPKPADLA